jgi:hypothetical protein
MMSEARAPSDTRRVNAIGATVHIQTKSVRPEQPAVKSMAHPHARETSARR